MMAHNETEEKIVVNKNVLLTFIEQHMETIDGEWGDCRNTASVSLRQENEDIYKMFGLSIDDAAKCQRCIHSRLTHNNPELTDGHYKWVCGNSDCNCEEYQDGSEEA